MFVRHAVLPLRGLLFCAVCLCIVWYGARVSSVQSLPSQQNIEAVAFLPFSVHNATFMGDSSTSPSPTPTPDPVIDPNLLFVETFDGDPTIPTRWTSPDWEITIHQRDQDRLYEMLPMQAQHGPNCEAPPASHTITAFEDNLYLCRNHMMTANYGISDVGGYGMVYFTPNRLLDTTGDFQIQFDVSTYRVNPVRNWIDVWITPYDKNLQLTLNEWLPDVQGPAVESIQIVLTQENRLLVKLHENGGVTDLELGSYAQMEDVLELSSKVRTTMYIGVENNRLKVGLPQHNLWWYDTNVPEMFKRESWKEAVVQFGHHSYTPFKLCEFSPDPAACSQIQADTFHWDNVILYPVEPFELVQGTPRLITSSTNVKTFTSNAPAPAGAHLRFGGIGNNLEVSFDGGKIWQSALKQAESYPGTEGHFSSYWMPIPTGTTTVQFRGDNWWGGEWAARDISIWSRDGQTKRQVSSKQRSSAELDALTAFVNGDRDPNTFFCAIP